MSYIEFKDKTVLYVGKPAKIREIICTHPQVKMIWQAGGFEGDVSNPYKKAIRIVCLLTKDEIKHEFSDYGDGKAFDDAELFLCKLDSQELN